MAEPSKKSDEVEKAITMLFGVDRKASIRMDKCVDCGGEAKKFRDRISEREYAISGLCQKCQDSVFGKGR